MEEMAKEIYADSEVKRRGFEAEKADDLDLKEIEIR